MPLSVVIAAANRNDVTQLAAVLEGKVVCQVLGADGVWVEENLCADNGYAGKEADALIRAAGYIPHVVPRGEEKKRKDAAWAAQKELSAQKEPGEVKEPGEIVEGYRARRWVVEVSHSWFNLFRKLTIRYEKKSKNWLALHQLAACVIALRKITLPDGTNFSYG